MDAEQKSSRTSTLLFAAVTLLAAPAFAQTLQVNTTDITLPTAGQTFANISVTSSTGGAVPFTIAKTGSDAFYSVSVLNSSGNPAGTSGTTPQTVQVSLLTSSFSSQNGSFTITNGSTPSDVVTVNVHYVPGGSGGGTNLISATPNPLNLTLAAGGSTSTNVTLSTASAAPVPFSITNFTSNGNYITGVTSNVFTVSSASSAILTVNINAGALSNGVYPGSITITPVGGTNLIINTQLTVGNGSGSGTYQFTSGINTFNFAYPSGTQSAQTIVTSTDGTITTFNASTNANWLLINGTTALNNVAVNSALSLTLSSVAATLTTGSYTGVVTVSNPTNPANFSQLFVNLSVNQGTLPNLTANPPSLTFNVSVGSGQTQSQISLSTSSGATTLSNFNFTTQTGTGWLSASLNSFSLPSTITAFVNPAGLVAGTYNGSISVTFAGGVNGQQTFPVTLVVGGGSGGTNSVAPTSLVFSYQVGSGSFVPQQSVSVNGTGNISVGTITQTGSIPWISATGTGTAPGSVIIGVIPGALAAGTYTATVPVVTASVTTNVSVTLTVSSGVVIYANPATFNVSGNANTQVTISASDNSNVPFTASSSASWVTLGTPSSTVTPASMLITVDTSSLQNGLNTANVTIAATGAANNPLTIPIVANVTGSSAGLLTLSPSSISFPNVVANGSAPSPQTLTVSAATTTNFTVSTTIQSGGTNWLTVSPSGSLTTPQSLSVSVNQAGLAAGTYNATISLTANGVTQNVPVTLVVTGGSITVTPSPLVFTSSGTRQQSLTVTSAVSGSNAISYSVAAATSSGGTWLSTSAASGVTPSQFNVIVNPAGLATGTYQGTVTVTPSSGPAVTVGVTLNVTTLTVTASTATGATLSFAYRVGDSSPQGQTITVGGGSGATFSATASSTGNWLGVSSASGVVPAAIQATVNPTGLNSGTYNGTITVAGTGGATGSTDIAVTLTVTAPLPTISTGGVTNAASYLTGAISPGEIITIFGTAIGPTTAAGLTLDASGKVTTTLSGVQVLVNNFAAPMVFVSDKQVSAVVPYEVAPFLSATVQVKYLGQTSNGVNVAVAATAPGIFTSNQVGTGVAATDASQTPQALNTPANPAAVGDFMTIYMTGEGLTSPAITGRITPGTPPFTLPLLAPTVLVDGIPARVDFYGEAPTLIAGVLQINFVVPAGARAGERPLVVRMGGVDSQPGVTIAIK